MLAWPGIMCENFGLIVGAGLLGCLNDILCITLNLMYGGDTSLPAYFGIVTALISAFTLNGLKSLRHIEF